MEFERYLIVDQRKIEKKLGLQHRQLSDTERVELRTQRQERLKGVVSYTRDALREHGKGLIPEVIDCA